MRKVKHKYTTNDEDKALLKDYLEGNSEAFTPLFHKYHNIFFKNAMKWYGYKPDEIEDMASEFFYYILTRLDKYDPSVALVSTWMTICMKRFMITWYNKKNVKAVINPKYLEELGYINDGERTGLDIKDPENSYHSLERSSYRIIIKNMIRDLGKEDAKIFNLYFVEGLTQHETAETLGLPLNTMWYRVKKIREHLEKYKELL